MTAQPGLWDPRPAEQARDTAMASIESHTPDWASFADAALRDVAAVSRYVTSEMVLACLDSRGIPRPVDARAIGPVMKRAQKAGLIEFDGYERSSVREHHRDVQARWRVIK